MRSSAEVHPVIQLIPPDFVQQKSQAAIFSLYVLLECCRFHKQAGHVQGTISVPTQPQADPAPFQPTILQLADKPLS